NYFALEREGRMSEVFLSQQHEAKISRNPLQVFRLTGRESAKHRACSEVAAAKTVSGIGAALSNLTEAYYRDVLWQAKWSFACALAASVVAVSLFFIGLNST